MAVSSSASVVMSRGAGGGRRASSVSDEVIDTDIGRSSQAAHYLVFPKGQNASEYLEEVVIREEDSVVSTGGSLKWILGVE